MMQKRHKINMKVNTSFPSNKSTSHTPTLQKVHIFTETV